MKEKFIFHKWCYHTAVAKQAPRVPSCTTPIPSNYPNNVLRVFSSGKLSIMCEYAADMKVSAYRERAGACDDSCARAH